MIRIIFKTDAESSIGRGAVMYRAHFQPRMAMLIEAMAQSVEDIFPAAQVLRVTEGWRPQRQRGRRDLHTELRALDFTVEFPSGTRATSGEYARVTEQCRSLVGDANYDFEVHGEGLNLHIHAEYDPK